MAVFSNHFCSKIANIVVEESKYFQRNPNIVFSSGVQSSNSHFVEIFTLRVITRQSDLLQPLTVELRTLLLGLEFLEANSPLNFSNFPRPIVSGSVPGN